MTQMTQMEADKRDPQSYAVIGAAMEVHSVLGCGFLESVYQDALAWEFAARQIPFEREVRFTIAYKDRPLATAFRADFLGFDSLVIELKAQSSLTMKDEAQVINYLKAAKRPRALLINFGASRLEYKRVVYEQARSS